MDKLTQALQALHTRQDQDTVNEIFGQYFIEPGQFAVVDLINGSVIVCDLETGDKVNEISFKISIEKA